MEQRFMSIRQTAAQLAISETFIRRMVKAGNAEGFYSGRKFYVDLPAFREMLDGISKANRV